MPDLGNRANVNGPQPIAQRKQPPAAMLETAERVLRLLAAGKGAELAELALPEEQKYVAEMAEKAASGKYNKHEIIATARVNEQYFVKARLSGERPFTVQFRLGQKDGRWMIWEANNLTGRRSGWTQ
jgi:hypothetical protein